MGKQSLCTVKPPYATPRVAATTVGVSLSTIRTWIKQEVIPSYVEVDPKTTSDGRRGWVRRRNLKINPDTGKPFDLVPGRPIYVDVNELNAFLARRARALKGLP
jgi:hypothetical protein